MGEGPSRLEQQHALYKDQLKEMRKQEALNEEQHRRQADEYHKLVLESQKKAAEKEAQLREGLRKIEEEQIKRAQELSVNSFHNKVMNEYDAKIKEKSEELRLLRDNSAKELEILRKNQEEENRRHLEDLIKIHENIVKREESHTEMMKAFLEQNNAGRSGLQDKILEANQKFHEVTMNMIKSRSETTAIIIGILNNVAVKSAIEKDSNNLNTKIDMMRQMISKMEDQRRRIVDWLVENDLKKTKKGFNAVLARAVPEKAETVQTHLKSMAEDSSILGSLIKDSILLISNANFDHDLIEKAKGALNFAQGKIADLFDEIATLRVAMAKSPRSVILDGIKGHLKDLDLAINSVPSMVTQTTNQFIQEQMKKLEVKDQEFINGVNNGLTMNDQSTLAIEEP